MADLNLLFGHHLLLDLSGCQAKQVDDLDFVTRTLEKAIETAGLTILQKSHHIFSPQGLTALYLLAESHFSFHSWPEHGTACLDLFTCGDPAKAHTAIECVVSQFHTTHHNLTSVERRLSEHKKDM